MIGVVLFTILAPVASVLTRAFLSPAYVPHAVILTFLIFAVGCSDWDY
jgi:hypothetical protein